MNNRTPIERSNFNAKTSPEKIPFQGKLPLRILSLDGGGIKGVFSAAYLAKLEELIGDQPIGNYFDMVAGTSTGGIIALGLAKGLSAGELKKLYIEQGPTIFPKPTGLSKYKSDLFFSKFDNKPLSDMISQIVGDTTLGESQIALCIASVNAEKKEPAIFKTPHHPDFEIDWVKPMCEIGMGTSAAPTYLKPSKDDDYILLDGALIGNNPIMFAVVDILSRFQVSNNDIRVLSIGTGSHIPALTKKQIDGTGKLGWTNAVDHFNFYQSKNVVGQACLLIGPQNVHRVEPIEENRGIDLADCERAIEVLPEDAERQAIQDFKLLKPILFEKEAAGLDFFYGSRSK